jgi:uncharacterized protein YcbK (DUF882 family)
MKPGSLTTAGVLVCALLFTATQVDAKGKARSAKAAKKRGGKVFSGHGVDRTTLRKAPVPRPSGDVWIYSVNTHAEVRVNIYKQDGLAQATAAMTAVAPLSASRAGKPGQGAQQASDTSAQAPGAEFPGAEFPGAEFPGAEFDDEALAQLDQVFRCKRTGEVRAINPRLYQTLSVIYTHFGGKRIELISGFRFQREEGSRHFHGSAMDIRIPGVSIYELRKFAESLDTGGMGIGIYPRANFVHVDWRAPGEPSFRWVDRSSTRKTGGKRPSRRWKHRPQS